PPATPTPSTPSLHDALPIYEELARRIRHQWVESLAAAAPSVLPPDLELRSLKRTRRLLGGQRWLFGFAIACTSVGMSLKITFAEDRKSTRLNSSHVSISYAV